ncbi:methyl-accepting chemotaxis protein [Sphingomonas sp. BK235]|uniref:methyl-accepting chemotaxis protein n=1 Tax=Sphingomonas sp. BK235 TaxID=2512131 RepID=UPI0010EDD3A5|nr:methyl-accepting chemotaxis protein [Sphingomonas sp. BK235]TCP30405.1 methyl-accepting chemotaxis protein [Sphingomonas sp. BK235]
MHSFVGSPHVKNLVIETRYGDAMHGKVHEEQDDRRSILDQALDYRRDFVVPMMRMIGLAVASVAALLIWLSVQADRREMETERNAARTAIDMHLADMQRYLKDCAAWDVALQNLVVKLDRGWANENIGPYLFKSQDYESSFVVDSAGHTTYASYGDRLVKLDARSYLGLPIRLAIDTLKAAPAASHRQISGLTLTTRGNVAAFAVAPITPDKGLVAQPPGGPSFLILVDDLTARDARSIGVNHQLADLQLVSARQPADLVLSTSQGRAVGGLRWSPRRPGSTLRRQAVPIMLMVCLGLALAGRRLLARARRAIANANAATAGAHAATREALDARERVAAQEREARLTLERTVSEVRAENTRLNRQAEASRSAALREAGKAFQVRIAPELAAIRTNADAMTSAAESVRARVIGLLESMDATSRLAEDAARRSAEVSPETAAFDTSAGAIAEEAVAGLDLARAGTAHGENASASLIGLAEALDSIDAVVGSIDAIARQTDFLALNAKIEAARSGGAGAGFSVVAAEVKTLALEAADLTRSVAEKVAGVRTSAGVAAASISKVSDALARSERASDAITHAVGRQRLGASVIRESVESIVVGSQALTLSVQQSRDLVVESRHDADVLEAMSQQLDASLASLRSSSDQFVEELARA